MGLIMFGLAIGAPVIGFVAAVAGGVVGFTGGVVVQVVRALVRKAVAPRRTA